MPQKIIQATQNWITQVVIGCNFCPFAAQALLTNGIKYTVANTNTNLQAIAILGTELQHLITNNQTQTTLIIFPTQYPNFSAFLKLVQQANFYIKKNKLQAQFQLATFHPNYIFAQSSSPTSPQNYTNRSPYPIIHILRQQQLTDVLKAVNSPENIPLNNIKFTQQKGLEYMQQLLQKCIIP